MILRKDINRPLTKEEVDSNFLELKNQILSLEETINSLPLLEISSINNAMIEFNQLKESYEQINEEILASTLSEVYDEYSLKVDELIERIDTVTAAIQAIEDAKNSAIQAIEDATAPQILQNSADIQDLIERVEALESLNEN
jgi:tetrahydromethanopterin S-methyltransferase subunit G